MQRLVSLVHAPQRLLPDLALEQSAVTDRAVDELRPLIENAPGPDRVVSDLAVTHVGIGGHSDGLAMRVQTRHQRSRSQRIQMWRRRQPDGIAVIARTAAHAVHHTDDHGPAHTCKVATASELPISHRQGLRTDRYAQRSVDWASLPRGENPVGPSSGLSGSENHFQKYAPRAHRRRPMARRNTR